MYVESVKRAGKENIKKKRDSFGVRRLWFLFVLIL